MDNIPEQMFWYIVTMEIIPDLTPGRLVMLVLPPRAPLVLELLAQAALRGSVCVLDGGNSLDAHWLARRLRRERGDLEGLLANVEVARSFTCYQMLTLLKKTEVRGQVILVLDMLATFYDESVHLHESRRVLEVCTLELLRLSRSTPIVLTACPPRLLQPERQILFETLGALVDLILAPEPQEQQPALRLL
jgi:hypothetical protein